jgi:hypothetical protein
VRQCHRVLGVELQHTIRDLDAFCVLRAGIRHPIQALVNVAEIAMSNVGCRVEFERFLYASAASLNFTLSVIEEAQIGVCFWRWSRLQRTTIIQQCLVCVTGCVIPRSQPLKTIGIVWLELGNALERLRRLCKSAGTIEGQSLGVVVAPEFGRNVIALFNSTTASSIRPLSDKISPNI